MIQSLDLLTNPPEPRDAKLIRHPLGEGERPLNLQKIPLEQPNLEPSSRIAYHTDPHGLAADRYRFLRMRLREHWKAGRLKTLLITSPSPQDGKSTVSLNLATALAEHGNHSVLLLEADIYRSPLIGSLGLKPGPGLSECLENDLAPFAALRRLDTLGWYLLPAGKPAGNPGELLHGEALARMVQTLSACFDWIIIDSPPIEPFSDTLALARLADASLLVARAGRTSSDALTEAAKALGTKKVLGIVLNGVEGLERRYSKYYSHYNIGARAGKGETDGRRS